VTRASISILRLTFVAVGITALSRDAIASPAARLVYARSIEASSCPDEVALRNAVAARLGYDPFFPWARQTVVVQVWREGGRYRARLQLVDDAGLAHGTRGLSSEQKTCAELFDAAALAISIAMDSLPKTEPAPASDPQPPAPPNPVPVPADIPAPAPPAPPPVPPEPPAEKVPLRVRVGIDGLASLGFEPASSEGVALSAGVRAGALSGDLEVRVDASASASSESGPGQVAARAVQVAAVPCGHVGELSLCAVAAAGVLDASSAGITDPRTASAVFVAAGPRVGFEWPLSRVFSLRVHLDALFDLRRPTLEIGGSPAWAAPIVAGTVGAGVAAYIQ
jgi:hypothetical protein